MTLLEAAVNSRDITQLGKLLSELRQQTFYHLLFRNGGEWRERKRIDRHGNYVGAHSRIHSRSLLKSHRHLRETITCFDQLVKWAVMQRRCIVIYFSEISSEPLHRVDIVGKRDCHMKKSLLLWRTSQIMRKYRSLESSLVQRTLEEESQRWKNEWMAAVSF